MSLLAALGCTDAADDDDGPSGSTSELAATEVTTLLFTREEEKLARDVYDALDAYGQVFVNIQSREQHHFDAVGGLIVTYGLEDPAAGNAWGVLRSGAPGLVRDAGRARDAGAARCARRRLHDRGARHSRPRACPRRDDARRTGSPK